MDQNAVSSTPFAAQPAAPASSERAGSTGPFHEFNAARLKHGPAR